MRSLCRILIIAVLISLIFALENNTSVDEFDSKIIGGTLAEISSFPSQVVFYFKKYGQWCGGTLIERRWVLSTAKCFYGIDVAVSNYLVRAGSNFYNKGGAVSNLEKIIPHPRFSPVTYDYNIAMVKLKYGFPEAVRKQYPIRFAELTKEAPNDWTEVWVTGWGITREFSTTPVRELRKVNVKIIPRSYCNTETVMAGYITPRMICAGKLSGGKDACQGDEGGPMYQGGRLVGITSWGFGCGRPNTPGAYTNVAAFLEWIEEKIRAG